MWIATRLLINDSTRALFIRNLMLAVIKNAINEICQMNRINLILLSQNLMILDLLTLQKCIEMFFEFETTHINALVNNLIPWKFAAIFSKRNIVVTGVVWVAWEAVGS